jgi:hypothetical protein
MVDIILESDEALVTESSPPADTIVDVEEADVILTESDTEATIITTADAVAEVVTEESSVSIVETISVGPQGPSGLPGPAGHDGFGLVDGELHLTPKNSSTGPEGTIFYCTDKYVYVAVEF